MKAFVLVLLVLVLLAGAGLAGYMAASQKSQSEIKRARTETAIYKAEAEKYTEVLRGIRETAQAATVTEKAQ